MKITGFTYVRNGINYQYPFVESIKSALTIVDEMIVVVGDSTDGTRQAVENINSEKIRIIDSVWDMNLRKDGKIFAIQTNIGLLEAKGDWLLHIQADEVLHESAGEQIIKYMEIADKYDDIDGLLFHYYHFWGDYNHIRTTRKVHPYEIRAFKPNRNVFSYKDSQGFRKYSSYENYLAGEKGEKLKVIDCGVMIYHYSYCRNPKLMQQKTKFFARFWHNNEELDAKFKGADFDYNDVDYLCEFKGEHPVFMKETIERKDWDFTYDPSKSTMNFKGKLLMWLEKRLHRELFRYTNYILVKDLDKRR